MSVTYLTYREIDKIKWDNCIHHALNRLIYPQSFYLDAMAENWDGLVLNDYEAVMPLTWKKKLGIKYLYQPAFFQQGGIYFTKTLSSITMQDFTSVAFKHFKFAEITFNYGNHFEGLPNCKTQIRNNFVLALDRPYDQIAAGFPHSIIKNLNRIKHFNLQYQTTDEYFSIIELYETLYGNKLDSFTKSDYKNFASVCKIMVEQNSLVIRKVVDESGNLLSASVLLKDNNRLYNMISCVTSKGRDAEANYFLYSQLIKEFCNTNYIFDFEGSDIKGIADFYSRFQGINESYPFVKMNRLHPFIKLFKR